MIRNKFQRLTKEEKEIIKILTLAGKSLNQISNLRSLNKNTVYYNVRKFKPKVNRDVLIHKVSDREIGELLGAFAGDGSYYHQAYNPAKKNSTQHRIRYPLCLSEDFDYGNYLLSLLKKVNLNPFIIRENKDNALIISLSSKNYIELIKKYLEWEANKTKSIQLRQDIKSYSNDFLSGFARGLMDTDGYVETSNVSCACISKNLIGNLINIFDIFRIKYKLTEKMREGRQKLFLVRVYSESLDNYLKTIGFSNPYKLEALNRILNKKNSKD